MDVDRADTRSATARGSSAPVMSATRARRYVVPGRRPRRRSMASSRSTTPSVSPRESFVSSDHSSVSASGPRSGGSREARASSGRGCADGARSHPRDDLLAARSDLRASSVAGPLESRERLHEHLRRLENGSFECALPRTALRRELGSGESERIVVRAFCEKCRQVNRLQEGRGPRRRQVSRQRPDQGGQVEPGSRIVPGHRIVGAPVEKLGRLEPVNHAPDRRSARIGAGNPRPGRGNGLLGQLRCHPQMKETSPSLTDCRAVPALANGPRA
jgi:hypothetical protein